MICWTLMSIFAKIKPPAVPLNIFCGKTGPELLPSLHNVRNRLLTTSTHLQKKSEASSDGFNELKAKIILSLNFKSPDDCLPFYKLPIKKLVAIQKITKNDEQKKFCENRLYYISSKIKCPPALVSEKLARRTFVYDLSFEWLEKSLDCLLEKGITGDRILRDLWVLKYSHKTIRSRLQKIQDMGVDVLYPWMVRCTPEILEKYINLSQETKTILGENKSTQIYLANRLNISVDAVEDIWEKMPGLRKIRVPKIKNFLDFLMEEGFSEEDIAKKLRILASSQKTIKCRLDKLYKLGLTDINLNTLCRSRKHFQKYYESLEAALKDVNISQTDSGCSQNDKERIDISLNK